jgi:hypothetical protein
VLHAKIKPPPDPRALPVTPCQRQSGLPVDLHFVNEEVVDCVEGHLEPHNVGQVCGKEACPRIVPENQLQSCRALLQREEWMVQRDKNKTVSPLETDSTTSTA